MHYSVTFNFSSGKVCSPTIFETSFSYDKDIWLLIILCTLYNCAISIFFLLDRIFSTLTLHGSLYN